MGVSVIAGDFVAGAQVSEGIKLDSPEGDADEGAGIAGMVDELEGASADASVDCLGRTELHNGNSRCTPGAAARFPDRDAFSGKLAELGPALYFGVGEESRALDRTLSHH